MENRTETLQVLRLALKSRLREYWKCAKIIWIITLGGAGLRFWNRYAHHLFLFQELVKRDFKKKYKNNFLGAAWSVLSPMFTMLCMRLVFANFFGIHMEHYTTYIFCGNLVFSFFTESASGGMFSLVGNAGILRQVNVPKSLFLLSRNVQVFINFLLSLCVFFLFCVLDGVAFSWRFLTLAFPIFFLLLFNIGTGLLLAVVFIYFRDVQYIWTVAVQLLMYASAIFYRVDAYPLESQRLFLLNPLYVFIRYFRWVVLDGGIPDLSLHLLIIADALAVLGAGLLACKKYSGKLLYHV